MPAPADLWHALPFPAFTLSRGGHVLSANLAAEEFLNISDRQLTGQRLFDLVIVDPTLTEALARMQTGQGALHVNDVELVAAGRAGVLCNLQATHLRDPADALLLLIQPRGLSDRLGRAQGPTRAARSAIGMADMLAHEIKNPLAGISGAAQLLAMGLGPEDRALTDLIVVETRRIVKLLEQVEQFGHLRPPVRGAVNIHDVLDRARRSAELGFARTMRFAESFDPSLPPVWADPDQLTQVFLNLFRNAAEAAGPSGGTIRIHSFYDPTLRLRRGDASHALPVQVEVSDDGPGIPPAILDEIFDPFVSGRENGSGLGLALVSRIIGDLGGWIGVDSRPGLTSFRIALEMAPKEGTL